MNEEKQENASSLFHFHGTLIAFRDLILIEE